MEFIAINLDDFHKNQKDAGTTASMIFIEAEDINKAQRFVEHNRPESPWALVYKQVFDANIVTRQKFTNAVLIALGIEIGLIAKGGKLE